MSIIAGTVDDAESTAPIADPLGYPVAIGVTRDVGDAVGAFWEPRRDHIQPSEFLLRRDGRVIASTYSAGPIGRMDPKEALTMVRFLNEMARKKAGG